MQHWVVFLRPKVTSGRNHSTLAECPALNTNATPWTAHRSTHTVGLSLFTQRLHQSPSLHRYIRIVKRPMQQFANSNLLSPRYLLTITKRGLRSASHYRASVNVGLRYGQHGLLDQTHIVAIVIWLNGTRSCRIALGSHPYLPVRSVTAG